jgi:hypothetical protein
VIPPLLRKWDPAICLWRDVSARRTLSVTIGRARDTPKPQSVGHAIRTCGVCSTQRIPGNSLRVGLTAHLSPGLHPLPPTHDHLFPFFEPTQDLSFGPRNLVVFCRFI